MTYKARRPGKKFDEIAIRHNDITYKIEIRSNRPKLGSSAYSFDAYCDQLDLCVLEYADLPTLTKAIREAIAEATKFKFEPVLIVEVDGDFATPVGGGLESLLDEDDRERHYGAFKSKCAITVDPTFIAHTGQKDEHGHDVLLESSHPSGSSPHKTTLYHHWRHNEQVKTMLPDTEANRVALQSILDGMKNLHDRLQELLSQDRIDHTIKLVIANDGLKLLPAKSDAV